MSCAASHQWASDDAVRRFDCVNAALAAVAVPGSVSIGTAELEPADTVEDMLARADAAMYRGRQERHHPAR